VTERRDLDDFLAAFADTSGDLGQAIARTILSLSDAARDIAGLMAAGPIVGNLAQPRLVPGNGAETCHGQGCCARSSCAQSSCAHLDGDGQKELDVRSNDLLLTALRKAPVAIVGSEELAAPLILTPGAPLAVAIDPLDGSSNIDTNAPVGTIFSLLPMPAEADAEPLAAFLQGGLRQVAAGFFIYGAHTALVISLGNGTHVFTLDRARDAFVLTGERVSIAPAAKEFAINSSNNRHWSAATRLYVEDCLAGSDGPRQKDFNMRWIASMVAEAYRILVRGGVYLYPADERKNYGEGRLRLVYEANAIALIMEQAGGAATDGNSRILELVPAGLHQRVPLVFGSRDEVAHVARYNEDPAASAARSPLFGRRSLFRV
jgi:fructose-1,6-bisphosphatase I